MSGVNFPRLQKSNSGSDSVGTVNKMNSLNEMSYFAPGILTPMVFEKPKCYAKTSFDVADNYT
jgi:hypothetical protein